MPDGSLIVALRWSHRLAPLRHTQLTAHVAVCLPLQVNAAWVISQRKGQPLDIDEAGCPGNLHQRLSRPAHRRRRRMVAPDRRPARSARG